MKADSIEAESFPVPPGLLPRAANAAGTSRWIPLLIFAMLFALAIVLQIFNGAFRSEFNAYPDEPAHYVTSLMVREYLTGPHPFSPLKFAEQYYYHYPKVAFGHWPPAFYIVQAFWMLLFSASRTSIRLELAFTTALLAFSVWREFRRSFGNASAILAAGLLVCLPLVQNATDEEMAESLLALSCFWSVVYFGRYLESGKLSESLYFALFFSLAVLTKGSGWLLALVPPIAFLFTRKLRYLLRGSFWYAVLLVSVLCLPWQLVTLRAAERGWTGGSQPSISYTLSALAQFFGILIWIIGPILSLLVLAGIVTRVLLPLFSKQVNAAPAVMFSLLMSDWLFHALVPAGVEDRKMIIAVPALLYFLFAGGLWAADFLPFGERFLTWRRPLVAVAAAAVFFAEIFTIPKSDHYGYSEAARYIVANPKSHTAKILVSSGSIGEGLLVSEVAMQEPRPQKTILRATKELAQMDWTGTHYHSRFERPSELLDYLRKTHVDNVVVDTYSAKQSFAHQKLVERTIALYPGVFTRLAGFPGRVDSVPGNVRIYRVTAESAH